MPPKAHHNLMSGIHSCLQERGHVLIAQNHLRLRSSRKIYAAFYMNSNHHTYQDLLKKISYMKVGHQWDLLR
ncbi:hypothetical protein QJS04_geneDACA018374 [Acorus gramineus]|uniref:Uncharacterized protein n=1 Tax=Acorus gramineus TaxID=55184 RepID=A0AAV9ACD8_ACOGR|nr:hypothetical protein QJS04_geneDACA018374 [Acorus gramineus]